MRRAVGYRPQQHVISAISAVCSQRNLSVACLSAVSQKRTLLTTVYAVKLRQPEGHNAPSLIKINLHE